MVGRSRGCTRVQLEFFLEKSAHDHEGIRSPGLLGSAPVHHDRSVIRFVINNLFGGDWRILMKKFCLSMEHHIYLLHFDKPELLVIETAGLIQMYVTELFS